MQTQHLPASASDLRARLEDLQAEVALAALAGLTDVEAYMDDLRDELAATRSAYVGAAVTEIASLRARLDGELRG